jgi:hypothetical protein
VRRLFSSTILPILLALTIAGCSRLYYDWNTHTFRRTPDVVAKPAVPAAAPTRAVAAAPTSTQSTLLYKRKHKHVASTTPDMKEMSIQPETTQSSPIPPATSTISLATPGGDSDNAKREIEAAGQRLSRFDRNQLNGPTLATYDQANGFLSQGKQALEEKDYVAASGFAQKASVLTDKLQATVTAR